MADDIEAFLRRAAERRKQQAGRKPTAAPRPRPEYTDSRRERHVKQVQPEDVVIQAELVDDGSLGGLSNRHLQDTHLAETVENADENMDAHIQQVFDHQVGRLSHRDQQPTSDVALSGDLTQAIILMLQSPQGLQQAILLSEIFERPIDRW